jgi:hypothetical protein
MAMKGFRLTISGGAKTGCIVSCTITFSADSDTAVSEGEDEMAFRNLLKSAVAFACLSVLATGVGLAPARADDKISIIMGGGPLWDPFFGAMKKGADDAAKDLGVDYLSGSPAPILTTGWPTTPSCSSSRPAAIPRRW